MNLSRQQQPKKQDKHLYYEKSDSLDLEPGYAGIPIIYITDRNQRNYTFVRGTVYGWSSLGQSPNWPNLFLQTLFTAFEEEYQKVKVK